MRSASRPQHRHLGQLFALVAICLLGVFVAAESRAGDGPDTQARDSVAAESAPAAEATADSAGETPPSSAAESAEEAQPPGPPKAPRARAKRACRDGWITDDGSADAGYGFVPSAREGIYVQQIQSDELPSRQLEEICVCLYKGVARRRADFEIVFYEDRNGRPAAEPYAALPARARIEPKKFREAEFFFQVDASEVEIPEGSSYVGVRWDPKEQLHLFVCGDKTEATEVREGFYIEDRAKAWAQISTSRDPIFRDHRALMFRLRSQDPPAEGATEGEPAAATGDDPGAGEPPADGGT